MPLIKKKAITQSFLDVSFNGSETTKNIDVTSLKVNAQKYNVQLLDSTYDRIYCNIKATTTTNMQVVTGTPLPAGTYRLILS